ILAILAIMAILPSISPSSITMVCFRATVILLNKNHLMILLIKTYLIENKVHIPIDRTFFQ
ncbi:MAG TPA: hypothetical protein VG759_08240, partial [Candidatus Angelobacter sp.]|nr:hypothetical protein [Candidatus Angelobacter sp.]